MPTTKIEKHDREFYVIIDGIYLGFAGNYDDAMTLLANHLSTLSGDALEEIGIHVSKRRLEPTTTRHLSTIADRVRRIA